MCAENVSCMVSTLLVITVTRQICNLEKCSLKGLDSIVGKFWQFTGRFKTSRLYKFIRCLNVGCWLAVSYNRFMEWFGLNWMKYGVNIESSHCYCSEMLYDSVSQPFFRDLVICIILYFSLCDPVKFLRHDSHLRKKGFHCILTPNNV